MNQFYLKRFLDAQESGGLYDNMTNYHTALQELRNGHKQTHWIWYIFPQMKGLGKSNLSKYYGINGREEAYAYIDHPVLRERLVEITQAVFDSKKTVYEIFGADTIKVRDCMRLFASVSEIPVFRQMLLKYKW